MEFVLFSVTFLGTLFPLKFQVYCLQFEKSYYILPVFSWTKIDCLLIYYPYIGKRIFPLSTSRTRVHLRRTWDRSKSWSGFSQHFTGSMLPPFKDARSEPQCRLGLNFVSLQLHVASYKCTNVTSLRKFITYMDPLPPKSTDNEILWDWERGSNRRMNKRGEMGYGENIYRRKYRRNIRHAEGHSIFPTHLSVWSLHWSYCLFQDIYWKSTLGREWERQR